jgi:two-component system, NtrC family, response regulator HydG
MTITGLIGSSPKFRAVLDEINIVAPSDCAVLIQGETGTGKEMIAQAIHDASPRRQQRFVGGQLCGDSCRAPGKRIVRP